MQRTTTVRVTEETRQTLRHLAAELGSDMQDVLAQAVDNLRRELILEKTNEAYGALSGSERDETAIELASWEQTLADGLDR